MFGRVFRFTLGGAIAAAVATGCSSSDAIGADGGSPSISPQQPAYLCDPQNDTCAANTHCAFRCTSTPAFQCVNGATGTVAHGATCSATEACSAGAICISTLAADGGISAEGRCTAYCTVDSDCPTGESCKPSAYLCQTGGNFTIMHCRPPP
jgi:hypothetical protein